MEASISSPRRGKSSWFQPTIIRLYKIAGIVALSAILVGLLAFVTVNVFYFFNRSWVRPVILTENHAKVIEASGQLEAARKLAYDLEAQRVDTRAALAEIDRRVNTDAAFLKDVVAVADKDALTSIDAAVLRRQIDEVTLEHADALDKKVTLTARLKELDSRIDDQRKLLEKIGGSPYGRGMSEQVVVVFIPYQNRANVTPGTSLYACSLGLIGCSSVGKVLRYIPGESTDVHPHDNSFQRGVMAEVELTDRSAGEERVLFAGKKPLWFF